MFVTDLDGTLAGGDRTVGAVNRRCLEALGERGVLRVIATGRSLYSVRAVLEPAFPVDYLAFSSGAGIVHWPSGRLVRSSRLTWEETAGAVEVLLRAGADFMVHRRIPVNHRFLWYGSGEENLDFRRRIDLYRNCCSAGPIPLPEGEYCQVVAIFPPGGAGEFERVRSRFPGLTAVRSTSPLDRRSIWLEIYPAGVSKAAAARWLAARHGIRREETGGIGNDYNDHDLLSWVAEAFVVANAPGELRSLFPVVASNRDDGFSEAARRLFRP